LRVLSAPKQPSRWIILAYQDYSVGRQTLSNLALKYGKSERTLRRAFDQHAPSHQVCAVSQEAVALTFDGTFFGRGCGLMIYRAAGRNIYWQEIESETIAVVEQGLRHLLVQGWCFSSITIDGRKGFIKLISRLLPTVPIQLCLFHQKAIVRRYLTTKPKTRCGQELRDLTAFLGHISEKLFLACLVDLKKRYADFLKERNDQGQFKHRRTRAALRSLTTNAPWLFTTQRHPNLAIPTTTNSCDGSFAHWKAKVKIHRGLRHDRRAKMIQNLLSKT
jgi:hypothetical protein